MGARAHRRRVLIVWLVVTGPRLQRFFERGPLAWLGRVSFGLYLLHFVTLCTVGCWVALTLLRHGYGRAVAFAAASIVTLAVSLGAADLFSRLVDQPSIRLARRVGARLSRSRKRVTGHGCPNGRTCRHGRVVPARLPGLDP